MTYAITSHLSAFPTRVLSDVSTDASPTVVSTDAPTDISTDALPTDVSTDTLPTDVSTDTPSQPYRSET